MVGLGVVDIFVLDVDVVKTIVVVAGKVVILSVVVELVVETVDVVEGKVVVTTVVFVCVVCFVVVFSVVGTAESNMKH